MGERVTNGARKFIDKRFLRVFRRVSSALELQTDRSLKSVQSLDEKDKQIICNGCMPRACSPEQATFASELFPTDLGPGTRGQVCVRAQAYVSILVPLTCDYEEAFVAILTLQDADQLLQGLLAVDE